MQAPALIPGRPGKNKKRRGILPVIDMTPMVDLGFLLIAFFVVTTELTRPTTLDLAVPKDGSPTPVAESVSLTIVVDDQDKIYYYEGDVEDAMSSNQIHATDYSPSGLRSIITQKQNRLDSEGKAREDLMVIIRPAEGASYKNVVDILDEMTITQVKKYTLAKPGVQDILWVIRNRIFHG